MLLGKILRIDVDVPEGQTYVSPSTNPFVDVANARDEIFAYGMRNPWRFSFDRASGSLSVADVGQGAREEVNMPVVIRGNYGWRIWEGFACTNNDPSLCGSQAGYSFPAFDYEHTGGRCSITGGYVYRGSQGALADGTYVYGDYCSGEIFGWTSGPSQSVLLDTALNISSFGEDESGELYVVGLGGTISKIVSAATATATAATSVHVCDFADARQLLEDGRNRIGDRHHRRRLQLDGVDNWRDVDHGDWRRHWQRPGRGDVLRGAVLRPPRHAQRPNHDRGSGVHGQAVAIERENPGARPAGFEPLPSRDSPCAGHRL